MKTIYEMAKKYYPEKWKRAMIDNLYEKGRLTEEEYNDTIGGGENETGDSN
jgi:hypothetical protein